MTTTTPAIPHVTLPPAPSFTWSTLTACWVPGDPFRCDERGVEGYYATKAAIAYWLRPTSVLEIGVRAGYSALAFHLGHPYATYVGIDADRGDWGGVRGYWRHAEATLAARGVAATIWLDDSQKLAAVPRADLAHIDGDHSYAGALHDIGLCLAAGTRYVVVDDYDLVADVRIAVREILGARRLTALYVGDGGYRGNVVLATAGVPFPDVTPHPETPDPCR